MPTNTSHPVKDTDLTIAYPRTGANAGYAVLHQTGCAHLAFTDRWDHPPVHIGTDLRPEADDWYEVAPCARASARRNRLED